MHVDSNFIAQIIPNVQFVNQPFPQDSYFNIDSRSIQPGEIFVALTGEKVDGHNFIGQALERKAGGFILAQSKREEVLKKHQKELSSKSVMFVEDPQQALIEIARAWRARFTIPVLGVTGSVGKTTTKEMIKNILKLSSYNAMVATGNQNTLIGISMNILKMRPEHTVAVFELGISDLGSMKKLADLARPTYAVITRIGHGHMLGLGDVLSIAKEKRDIFSLFSKTDIGVINGDQEELADYAYQHPVISFGKKTTNQIQARKIVCEKNSISFIAKIYNQKYSVILPTCNEARVTTALAAMSICYLLKIPNEILVQGVQQQVCVEGRFQMLQHASGCDIINDAYNANPESMKAALLAFNQYTTDKNKILVLGDMRELGPDSAFWHRQIGRFLRKVEGVKGVYLVGKEVEWMKKAAPIGTKIQMFGSIEDAFEVLKPIVHDKNNVILFKASNSLRLGELVKMLQQA